DGDTWVVTVPAPQPSRSPENRRACRPTARRPPEDAAAPDNGGRWRRRGLTTGGARRPGLVIAQRTGGTRDASPAARPEQRAPRPPTVRRTAPRRAAAPRSTPRVASTSRSARPPAMRRAGRSLLHP